MFLKNIIIPSIVFFGIFTVVHNASAQKDTSASSVQFSGYLETYYAYDFGNPLSHNRPGFIYSYNRHNEVNLNLGFVKANYQSEKVRANLALMAGNYVNANLAAEPGVLKNIFEANVGIKLSDKSNLWVDAGIFPSHIGFESAIGKDCWTLTRSLLAENSPYYESGAKLSYTTSDGKWLISALVLNGWQRIQRVDGNNTPGFGHQLTFKPTSTITLNSSSFIGNDKPDSIKQMRYFHNFFAQLQLTKKLGVIAGFDIGTEQKSKDSGEYNTWYSPVLIVKLSPSSSSSIAGRIEYYGDKNGVIIATGSPNGFQTLGYSVNFDKNIRDNVMWRIEARALSGKDKTFFDGDTPVNTNYLMTTSLAISF